MRVVVFAAKSPVWSYYMQVRIVAPTLRDAIAHVRNCHEMWRDSFVVVSDDEAVEDENGRVEPATELGAWPRGKFDMAGFLAANKRIRVIPAVMETVA